SKLLCPMITAPFSLSASPTISLKCSHALPIQANTSDGSSFLSAINPSSDTERPNMTFPMVFSDLCECYSTRQLPRKKQYTPREAKKLLRSYSFPTISRARFDQPKAGSRRDKRARALHAVLDRKRW